MLKRLIALAALGLFAPAFAEDAPPPGDPVALLDEAKAAVGAGEISHARKASEAAAQALALKQGEAIRAILPAPFDGWTINDGDTGNMGLIAMGGGLTIDRTYASADGSADVRIEIIADSDLVVEMAKMYADPAMIAASGMQTITVNGETGLVDPNDGKITMIVDGRSVFTISGSADAAVRKSYAENIDFPAYKAIK